MSRRAHFHVAGENFNGPREATVTVEENAKAGLFIVRPKGSRDVYSMPLAELAAHVIWKNVKQEAAAAHSPLRRSRS